MARLSYVSASGRLNDRLRPPCRWALQHNGTQPRSASGIGMQHWNYSLPVAAGASVQVLVTAVSAWIEARTPLTGLAFDGLVLSSRRVKKRRERRATTLLE